MTPHTVFLITPDARLEATAVNHLTDLRRVLRFAHSTPEAIARLASSHDIEVAVVDLDPDIEGIPLIEALTPIVPVIAVTERGASYLRARARERGACVVLEKPVAPETLKQAVTVAIHAMAHA